MWEYILGGVTLWGVIFGLIMFYNGRVTRKEISREIRELAKITRKDHEAIMAGLKEIVAGQKEIVAGQKEIVIALRYPRSKRG